MRPSIQPTSEHTPQACAIPFRRVDGRLEFCLITTRRSRKWAFPKGMVEPGDTLPETALKEAREEAGLRGRVVGLPVGEYTYRKSGTTRHVTAFLMQVELTEADWKESDARVRRWVSAGKARKLLQRSSLQELLEAAVRLLKSARAA